MINIIEKANCCGCTACKETCPTKAIEMMSDEEGFYYPHITLDKCINCEKCKKVCPIINKNKENDNLRKVYISQNMNDEIRLDSTSGGVFSALAQYVIDKKGYIFGAEFDENWRVIHGVGKCSDDLHRFRGSKYVQSYLGNTFYDVKRLLENEQWVLFTGTPCQIEGLVSYLHKQYDKLILMDLVCFSVSSPLVWKIYLNHLDKTNKIDLSEVTNIKFRDKTKYGYEYSLMNFYGKNGKIIYSSGSESNQMLRSFVSNTSVRPSCYDCKFKKINRVSDFTVWDCYNIYKYNKKLDDNRGTSHVMVHTVKAQKIIEEINDKYLRLEQVDINEAIDSEPAMIKSAIINENRKAFFKSIEEGNDCFDFFFKETIRVKSEKLLRKILSDFKLYSVVKRLVKG